MRSLRIKLRNDYRHPRCIATVAGQGYRFIATFSERGWIDPENRRGELSDATPPSTGAGDPRTRPGQPPDPLPASHDAPS